MPQKVGKKAVEIVATCDVRVSQYYVLDPAIEEPIDWGEVLFEQVSLAIAANLDEPEITCERSDYEVITRDIDEPDHRGITNRR